VITIASIGLLFYPASYLETTATVIGAPGNGAVGTNCQGLDSPPKNLTFKSACRENCVGESQPWISGLVVGISGFPMF
jgi:hypothetical protein